MTDTHPGYFSPKGGLPPQTDLLTGRAVFTDAYAVIPRGTMRDIVTSFLPFWERTRLWVLARPLSGFAGGLLTKIITHHHAAHTPAPTLGPILGRLDIH